MHYFDLKLSKKTNGYPRTVLAVLALLAITLQAAEQASTKEPGR